MTAATKIGANQTALKKARMLIGGHWVDSAAGEILIVENPAHRTPIAEIPRGRAEDVDRAVKAAAAAFPAWSRVAPRERGKLFLKIADALEARVEELARLIALETGNALRTQARPEAGGTVEMFRYYGGLGGELKGETIPLGEQVLSYTRREPLGVVGAIVPWNAPSILSAIKIAPALVAGNTLVLKAAEDAPLCVLLLAEVCQQFLPAGVLNVLTGLGEECGAPLAVHPTVRKLSRSGRPHRAGLAGAGGKKPVDRLSRRQRGLGRRRHRRGDALHPAEPVLHRRIAAVPASRYLRPVPRGVVEEGLRTEARRPARRGERHRYAHQREAVQARVRLR
jgi:betaine-aldehyde dehydrogenase